MDGILLFNKPAAWTSHDVVDAVRRKTGQRAVGHAGTLDPMATGLLVLLLGKATKRSTDLSGLDKSYRGSIRLGVETDSWDLDGRVLETRPVPDLSRADLARLFGEMTGERLLLPPVFSAIKKDGQKAYASARKGIAVRMESRLMRVYRLDLESYDPPEIHFSIDCSKGTYVRSIAHETGARLGCGATLSRLVRTRVGDWTLESAWDLERFALAPLPDVEAGLLA